MEKPFVQSIHPLWDSFPTGKVQEKKGADQVPFADIFQSAVENVRATDDEKTKLEYLLSTGELDNPAELTIASSKASIAVELLVELRNRSLESYNELMRMSI